MSENGPLKILLLSAEVDATVAGHCDTLQDDCPSTGFGTGFVLDTYGRWELVAAIVRKTATFRHREARRQIRLQGMRADFSWDKAARRYVDLYRRALASRRARPELESHGVQP